MQNGAMKAWLDSSYLSGSNQSWIEQLYEDFLTDPDSVDANWRSMFQQLPGTGVKPDQFHSKTRDYFRRLAKDASRYTSSISDPDTNVKQVKVLQLINAYRFRAATSMRISIRWGCGSKREWRISIRPTTI